MSPPCPAPRFCHLVIQSDFDGYGFTLHVGKSRPGHIIGIIDPGSPAEVAGLIKGDRIVEVNGANVQCETHKEVVERIKSNGSSVILLVSDKECDNYHKEHGLEVTSDLPYILSKPSDTIEDIAKGSNEEKQHPEDHLRRKDERMDKVADVAPSREHAWVVTPVACWSTMCTMRTLDKH